MSVDERQLRSTSRNSPLLDDNNSVAMDTQETRSTSPPLTTARSESSVSGDLGYYSDRASIPWTSLVPAEPVSSVGSLGEIPSVTSQTSSQGSGDFTRQGCQVSFPPVYDSGVASLAHTTAIDIGSHFPISPAQSVDREYRSHPHTSLHREEPMATVVVPKTFTQSKDSLPSAMSSVSLTSSSLPEVPEPEVSKFAGTSGRSVEERLSLFDQNEDGDTYLHLSVIYMLQNLFYNLIRLANAADLKVMLNIHNDLHQTALHLAVLTAQSRIVRILSLLGSPLGARDRTGNTSLHLAARTGDLKCVKALTSPVSDKERVRVQTLLHQQSVDNLDLHDPNTYNYDGDTCLHVAAAQGHLHTVQYLLDHVGCDVNRGDGRSGRTILHLAVESQNIPIINFLITNRVKYGVDLDAQTYEGYTALKLAHARGLGSLSSHFILLGADATLVHSEGEEDMRL